MVFWYYFYRPIVIEDVNNCLKIFSSCKSFLLLCSPSKSLVLKASESSREIVELASGCILRFSRLVRAVPSLKRVLRPLARETDVDSIQHNSWSPTGICHVGFPRKRCKVFPLLPRSYSPTRWNNQIIKCSKSSAPLQGCHLSIPASAQLQSLCGGPKSATRSNAPAAVPSRPYLNEHRPQQGAHIYGRNVGFLLSKVHAPCVSERRGPGRRRTMHRTFLFALRCGAALCYQGKCSQLMDMLLNYFSFQLGSVSYIKKPSQLPAAGFVCLLKKNLILCIFVLTWAFTDMLVKLETWGAVAT